MQNNTQNFEARKGHLGDEISPILPTSPILVPFALVSRAAMGVGVGSRPHDGPRPPSVRSSHPVSIEMPDSLIEEHSRDVSRLASLVLHSAGKQPRPRRLTALPINRSFNGYAALDPPGKAAVCGCRHVPRRGVRYLLACHEFSIPAIETTWSVAIDRAVLIMRQLVRPRQKVGAEVACDGLTLPDELGVIQEQVSFETVILQVHPLLV